MVYGSMVDRSKGYAPILSGPSTSDRAARVALRRCAAAGQRRPVEPAAELAGDGRRFAGDGQNGFLHTVLSADCTYAELGTRRTQPRA
jgi:hypothetical protein